MRRRPAKHSYEPMPENLRNYGTVNFLQPPLLPYANSSYNVKPWPLSQTPASGLGYVAPTDRDFAERNGAESGVGLFQTELHSNPIWARPDVIIAAKRFEHNLFVHEPKSRMHELNQFHSAHVSQPPQSLYYLPDECRSQ